MRVSFRYYEDVTHDLSTSNLAKVGPCTNYNYGTTTCVNVEMRVVCY